MGEHNNPPLTVDAIIEKDGAILMIRRKGDTYDGYLALPGGFVDYNETVENAVKREVKEELGVEVVPSAILGVYSDPNRDPRGHVISTVFICEFKGSPVAGDDASDFGWVKLDNIDKENLAFDHSEIIRDYIIWKKQGETFWSSKKKSY